MRIFAIRDETCTPKKALGYLLYYENAKRFYVELPDDADIWETPLLLSSFLRRGEHTVNAYWSKMWVQQRIVPPDRQNLGQVLKANGLSEYDEFDLLMLAKGRCAQDDCYLTEISEAEIPDAIQKRWEKKIEDVIPLAEAKLLVFFRDGTLKKCDIAELVGDQVCFSPIFRSPELFKTVSVQTGGYGVEWSETMVIDNEKLDQSGVEVPLTREDFISFLVNRVVNTSEATEILGCTRQNVDDLTRRGSLHPIREDTRNKLYLKSEVQQRLKS